MCLDLTPQPALVAADAVHEPGDVSEAVAELLFEACHLVLEHEGLVKDWLGGGSGLGELEDLGPGDTALVGVAGAERVVLEVVLELRDGAGKDGVVEVDVLYTLRVPLEAGHEALEVGAPLTRRLIQVVPAQMHRDTRMHARDDPVEDPLLQTHIVRIKLHQALLPVLPHAKLMLPLLLHHARKLHRRWVPLREPREPPLRLLQLRVPVKAILPIYRLPDILRAGARISREPLWVLNQRHIVSLAALRLILGHAVVPLITLILLHNAALLPLCAQRAPQRRRLRRLSTDGVRRLGPRQLAQLLRTPDLGDVLLVVDGGHGAGNVAAHALVVPEGACAPKEVEPVVAEVVRVVGDLLQQRVELLIECLDRVVGGAAVGDELARGVLYM